MMKKMLSVVALGTTLAVTAMAKSSPEPTPIKNMACHKQVFKELAKHTKSFEWNRSVNPQAGQLSYKTPTSTFGKWIELKLADDIVVYILDTEKSVIKKWKVKTCENFFSNSYKPLDFLKEKKKYFSDEKLKKLVDAKTFSLIYLWSPSMVYSVQEMGEFQKVAKANKMTFLPVLSHSDSRKHAQSEIQRMKLKVPIVTMQSLELFMRSPGLHYPMTFVVGKGVISQSIFGVMPEADLTEEVAKRVREINREVSL